MESEVELIPNCDLSKWTTFQGESSGDLYLVRSVEALKNLLLKFKKERTEYRLLGLGSNIVFPLKVKEKLIKLEFRFDDVDFTDHKKGYFDLPASIPLARMSALAIKHGFLGWEVLTGIPANLGGSIVMNAGTSLGETCEIISKVWIINDCGEIFERDVSGKDFYYRGNHFLKKNEIIIKARVLFKAIDSEVGDKIKKYLRKRSETQPLKAKTFGCAFQNHLFETGESYPAGKLIDRLGLKGLQYGGVKISQKHGNFLENVNQAKDYDVLEILDIIEDEVNLLTGIQLKREVKI